jgi:hypothetical protein
MTTPRRRQVFAQRRRAALDPSGAAGSGPAPTTPPAPVSREDEEAKAVIWMNPADAPLTPQTDPTANAPEPRKTLRLKRGRHAD